LQQGVVREVLEETGLNVVPAGIVEVLDRITPGEPSGRVRYHYVLIDFLCRVAGGTLRGGSDAEEARWVGRQELHEQGCYRLAPLTVRVIEKAFRLGQASDLDKESEA
jgi:ADP-ribose pyrophosphatase YjhB (NUDIX family)